MKNYRIALLIFVGLLLNACGGSSEEESHESSGASDKRLIQILVDRGNNGTNDDTIDYAYDENGNITFKRTDTGSDGDYDTVVEYDYDNNNNMIRRTMWWDKATIRGEEVLKTYDHNGNMLTNDITDYRHPEFGTVFNLYSYSGNKIASRRITSPGNTSVYTYLYTGNVLDIHRDEDNDGDLDYIETINYDVRGNIIQKGIYNPDGTLSTFFTGEVQTFSYDEHNNLLISGNASGTIYYRHSYTYDREGNMLTELFQPASSPSSLLTYRYE